MNYSPDINDPDVVKFRRDLLDWYDRTGRVLPWRVRPEDRKKGIKAEPYAVWLSEIMLQQTTIAHGAPYWSKFLERFPTVTDLANADRDEIMAMWAGLGYYARARNLHKCAQIIRDAHNGQFPVTESELLKLPGVGPYTAATIAAICFDEPTSIVDGNVERVMARRYRVEDPLPKAKTRLKNLAAPLADPNRPGDYGQALMDLGATLCTPKNPNCHACPVSSGCHAFEQGNPEAYPKKLKGVRPVKYGAAFALINRGHILMRRRPDDGLLGGMLELPGTEWTLSPPDAPLNAQPLEANWQTCQGQVHHVFTHFELKLDVYKAQVEATDIDGMWVPLDNLSEFAIPSLTLKAIRLALESSHIEQDVSAQLWTNEVIPAKKRA